MARLTSQPALRPDTVSAASSLDNSLQRGEARLSNSLIASIVYEPLATPVQPSRNNDVSKQAKHDFSRIPLRVESETTGSRYRDSLGAAPLAPRPTMHSHITPSPLRLQPKLTVNEPGDKYEQEADRIAEQVMRMPDADVGVQRKCASCEDDEKTIRRKAITESAGPAYAPPSVRAVLGSPGEPLDLATRNFFEPRFDRDLSHVRIHTDAAAAQSAAAVRAKAYTLSPHIVFGANQPPAGTLLAHELAHVFQQGAEIRRNANEDGAAADEDDGVPDLFSSSQSSESSSVDSGDDERDSVAGGIPPVPESVEVKATHIGGPGGLFPIWHTLIVHTDASGKQTGFRGGPGGPGGSFPYHTIKTTKGPYAPGFVDYPAPESTVVATGASAAGTNAVFGRELSRIDATHTSYFPSGPNSNTVTSTLLHKAGLPHNKPVTLAPGFDDADL